MRGGVWGCVRGVWGCEGVVGFVRGCESGVGDLGEIITK